MRYLRRSLESLVHFVGGDQMCFSHQSPIRTNSSARIASSWTIINDPTSSVTSCGRIGSACAAISDAFVESSMMRCLFSTLSMVPSVTARPCKRTGPQVPLLSPEAS